MSTFYSVIFSSIWLIAVLFAGYQKENERLYEEIKQLKSVDAAGAGGMADKTATAAMFKENQKLLKEIGDLRLAHFILASFPRKDTKSKSLKNNLREGYNWLTSMDLLPFNITI